MANLFFFFLNQTQITFLFMGYRFTSITLKLKPVCCTRVRRHNSISVELGVTGLAHVYEGDANTDDTKHSQLQVSCRSLTVTPKRNDFMKRSNPHFGLIYRHPTI